MKAVLLPYPIMQKKKQAQRHWNPAQGRHPASKHSKRQKTLVSWMLLLSPTPCHAESAQHCPPELILPRPTLCPANLSLTCELALLQEALQEG